MNFDMKEKVPMTLLIAMAVVSIVAFFLPWISMMYGISGCDFVTHHGDFPDSLQGFESYVPLLILILSIVAAIVIALPSFGVQMDSKVVYGIITAIGALMLIFMLVYLMKDMSSMDFMNRTEEWYEKLKLASIAGSGVYLGLLATVTTLFVGLFRLIDAIEGKS